MHTRVDILLCSQKSEEELLSVAERIHEALSCLEKTANYYDPASELAVVNRTASVSPVVLSSQLYAMVDLCLEYHEKTSGCFDVTVIRRIIIRILFIRYVCRQKNKVFFTGNRG